VIGQTKNRTDVESADWITNGKRGGLNSEKAQNVGKMRKV